MSVKKIYVIIGTTGEYEDKYERIIKAFTDITKAEKHLEELEDQERGYRDAAMRCRECAGLDKTCPFYVEPAYQDDECGAYEPYHDDEHFRIEEIILED